MVLPSIPDPPIDLKELLTNVKDINVRSKIKASSSALAFTTPEEALKDDNSSEVVCILIKCMVNCFIDLLQI